MPVYPLGLFELSKKRQKEEEFAVGPRTLANAAKADRLTLFIHGVNNSRAEAGRILMIRSVVQALIKKKANVANLNWAHSAVIWDSKFLYSYAFTREVEDLKIGAAVEFLNLFGYPWKVTVAKEAGSYLANTLEEISTLGNVQFDIVAISMGAQVLATTTERLVEKGVKLRKVALLCPAVESEVFGVHGRLRGAYDAGTDFLCFSSSEDRTLSGVGWCVGQTVASALGKDPPLGEALGAVGPRSLNDGTQKLARLDAIHFNEGEGMGHLDYHPSASPRASYEFYYEDYPHKRKSDAVAAELVRFLSA